MRGAGGLKSGTYIFRPSGRSPRALRYTKDWLDINISHSFNNFKNRIVIEVLNKISTGYFFRMTRGGDPLDTVSPIFIGAGRMTIFFLIFAPY
jgi:hypothetical protein